MFTVCPKCALTLVVTAADLRVAQGYVRCGRCSSVFNALAQLSDERGAALRGTETTPPEPEPEEPAQPSPSPGAGGAGGEESISEAALEFNPETTDAASVFVAAKPDPEWTAATGSFKSLVAANQEPVAAGSAPEAGAGDDFDVELDAALLSDIVQSKPPPAKTPAAAQREVAVPAVGEELLPGESAPTSPAPGLGAAGRVGRRLTGPATDPAFTPARSAGGSEHTALRAEANADVDDHADAFAALARPVERRDSPDPLLWTVGAVLLALILVAQIVNHQRDVLAADPRFNQPLTALYAALGVHLAPRWDLHAYDVRQLGATVDPGSRGAITVRASIRNAGAKAQPLPLLRVTLQDRFGNRLASRDVQPSDYLPPSIPPNAQLAPDQRIDAELAFVDPGASAVGFELDACLPSVGSGVACANDASAAR